MEDVEITADLVAVMWPHLNIFYFLYAAEGLSETIKTSMPNFNPFLSTFTF